MAKKKINKSCMEKCEFKAKNCCMHENGTWDCSARLEDCADKCRVR